jgi:hypothetical protein
MADVLESPHDERIIKRVTGQVEALTSKYPVYRQAEAKV